MWDNSFNFSNALRGKVYPPQFAAAGTKEWRGTERAPSLQQSQDLNPGGQGQNPCLFVFYTKLFMRIRLC